MRSEAAPPGLAPIPCFAFPEAAAIALSRVTAYGEWRQKPVGALHDPTFGPLVVCGSGGVLVDLLADSAFRIHPLTTEDAAEMIGEVRGARLLRGYRGAPPADEAALRDVVLRVSALLSICPKFKNSISIRLRC